MIEAIAEALPAQLALVDEQGWIAQTNRAWDQTAAAGALGHPGHPSGRWNYLEECRAAEMRGCTEAAQFARRLEAVLGGTETLATVIYACPVAGRFRWFQATVSPVEAESGRRALIMHIDVTTLQRDPLTGAGNRALYEAQCAYLLQLASGSGETVGTILIDLDEFKKINDARGHQAGDRLLVQVAGRLEASVRKSDLVTRIGGDEFAVVLGAIDGLATAETIAARIVEGLKAPFDVGGDTVRIGASAGVALSSARAETLEQLVKRADAALYAAKAAGRNCFRSAA